MRSLSDLIKNVEPSENESSYVSLVHDVDGNEHKRFFNAQKGLTNLSKIEQFRRIPRLNIPEENVINCIVVSREQVNI